MVGQGRGGPGTRVALPRSSGAFPALPAPQALEPRPIRAGRWVAAAPAPRDAFDARERPLCGRVRPPPPLPLLLVLGHGPP